MYLNSHNKHILDNSDILEKLNKFNNCSKNFVILNKNYFMVNGFVSSIEFEKEYLTSTYFYLYLNVDGAVIKIKVIIGFLSLEKEMQLLNDLFAKGNHLIALLEKNLCLCFTSCIILSESDFNIFSMLSDLGISPLQFYNSHKGVIK